MGDRTHWHATVYEKLYTNDKNEIVAIQKVWEDEIPSEKPWRSHVVATNKPNAGTFSSSPFATPEEAMVASNEDAKTLVGS